MSHQLEIVNSEHLALAADEIASGAIVVAGFNGIFVLLGDADEPAVADRIAAAKGRPRAKGLALVCPPEHLHEHVNLTSSALRTHHSFQNILQLYRAAHAIGAILPAGVPGAPEHIVQAGTVLNVWTEYPPHQPIRQLVNQLRRRGKRALAGTSANKTGQPTYSDPRQAFEAFRTDVDLMLLDRFDDLPLQRRRSTSIIDFSGPIMRLYREGSLTVEELRALLQGLGLGDLSVDPDRIRVVSAAK
jgi:tRNA A37 threonylcarbamoyladenosine synthetase subunit TsaC/SUA5/YrdC